MSTASWSSVEKRARPVSALLTPYGLLKWMGSLKITVGLFVLAILIVLIGTLAQDETLVHVKREYFMLGSPRFRSTCFQTLWL